MPNIQINTANIDVFSWSAKFKPYGQTIKFDTSSTTYNDMSGTGQLYVLGICFSVIDSQGVVLLEPDWDNPQIQPALGEDEYTLDLSSVGVDFFFQAYSIIGYIKDGDGQIYSTTQINPKICQPVNITSQGYVPGVFQVTANCPDSVLTVKEVTVLTYNNTQPDSVTKDGTLTYPSGTISPVSFTGTPFTNDEIYTGEYRVQNETDAIYSLGNDITVEVTYLTNNVFNVVCSNKISDILCCIVDLQNTKTKNCNNAVGQRAAQLEAEITIPFLTALTKEISGQDASIEVLFIKKTLNCNCGAGSIIQNEFTPINPAVTTIVLNGVGGTSIGTPTINGNTKTYNIQSNVYQVVKADTSDNSFTITLDTNTANTVKYKIAINYTVLSQTILNTISGNSGLLTQLNSLITTTNFTVDLSNLNGGCIIDLSSINYFLSLKVPSAANTFVNVVINGTTYTAPSPIAVNNEPAIESYLNGLGLGTFSVSFSTGVTGSYVNILTTGNANTVTSATFNIGVAYTVAFQMTNKSLIAFLQAVVDYVCALSALEVLLGQPQTISYIDYNGNQITVNLTADQTQAQFNTAISNVINTIQALNLVFRNGLTNTSGVVEFGGSLVKDTTITLAGYALTFGSAGNLIEFKDDTIVSLKSQGTSGTDVVSSFFQNYDNTSFLGSTVADRAAVSFYARSFIVAISDSTKRAILGSHYPVTFNGSIPAPAEDPDKTTYFRTSNNGTGNTGLAEIYGKTHNHNGEISNFSTLLRVKRMTTAERDAIDVGLLTNGLIIYNTTTNKFQGYGNSAWSDFN